MELKSFERDDDVTHVALIGRLDMHGLHLVDIKFHGYTAARRKPTIVDLSQLDYITSLGMGMLISCAQSLKKHGVKMILLQPQGMVETSLKVTGLDRVMPFAQSLDEALLLIRA